jgi:hypothetical protein
MRWASAIVLSRRSSVCTVTTLRARRPGFDSRQISIIILAVTRRPAVALSQPVDIAVYSSGVKRPEQGANLLNFT